MVAISVLQGQVEIVTLSTLKTTLIPTAVQSGSQTEDGSPTVLFSPSGETLAVSGIAAAAPGVSPKQTGQVELWSVSTGKRIYNLPTAADYATNSIAFSPDGKELASGGTRYLPKTNTYAGVLELWTVSTGKLKANLPTTATDSYYGVEQVAFSPDGTLLADSGDMPQQSSYGATIELWTLSNPTAPTVMHRSTTPDKLSPLLFSPDGTLLAQYYSIEGSPQSAGYLDEWNIPGGTLHQSLRLNVIQAAFSSDGSKLYTVLQNPTTNTQYLASMPGKLSAGPTELISQNAQVDSLAVAPNGSNIVCTTGNAGTLLYSPSQQKVAQLPSSNFFANVNGVAFSPDGKTLAASGATPSFIPIGGLPGGLMLYNPASGDISGQPQLGGGVWGIPGVSWSPDGKTLALGSMNLWSPATDIISSLPTSLPSVNLSLFAPAGTLFVDAGATSIGGAAEVRTVGSTATPTMLISNLDLISKAAISPDGTMLALAGSNLSAGVELWNLTTQTLKATFTSATLQTITGLAFSPDGKTLAIVGGYSDSSGSHGTVQWWSVKGHNKLGAASTDTQAANCVCYSVDGNQVLVGTEQSIQIYSTANYGRTTSYNVETEDVTAIAMSPTGATFAYGRQDGTIVVAGNPNTTAIRAEIAVNPGSVTGGKQAEAQITLSVPAPAGGLSYAISSDSNVAIPELATVKIPSGATSVRVRINTRGVASAVNAQLAINGKAGSATTTLTVMPK
jgi:WD40 repeat protein